MSTVSTASIGRKPGIRLWGDSLTEGYPGVSCMEILARDLPEVEFFNHGRSGDTTAGLLRRLKNTPPSETRADISVLWVGVNDIYSQLIPGHNLWKSALRQKPTQDLFIFEPLFKEILNELRLRSGRIVVLPPLFIGERPESGINRRLKGLGNLIGSIAESFPGGRFLDIRICLPLEDAQSSDYLPVNPFMKIVENFGKVEDADYDRASERRGLKWTYDGLHLNSAGARAISRCLMDGIQKILKEDNLWQETISR
jgi:lysophospholipase L1-like esterase